MKVSSQGPLDEEWMVGSLHAQLTAGSQAESEATVASTPENYTNRRFYKPLLAGCEPTGSWPRYSKPSESKYPLVVIIPAVLVVGILIGFTVAFLLLPVLRHTDIQVRGQGPYQLAPPLFGVPEEYYAASPFDNAKLIPNLRTISAVAGKPQSFDACGFVVNSTDEIWNKRGNVDAAIDRYFHEDYVDAGSWGRRIIGKKDLKQAVWGEMRAFPDIQIHITDCLCLGNDMDGYKCAMPDVLTGTNTGPSAYGPATGKSAKWTGLVQSLVKKNPNNGQWQYYAEWGVHDEWALIQQLGLDFSRVPRPDVNTEPLHDGKPLVPFVKGQFSINDYDAMQQTLHDSEKFPGA
jgi:hypothetical protein